MKRAARPGESESESDDEGEDALERRALAESRAASSGGAALRQVTSARAVAASDRAGLERACKSIVAADAPWLETLVLTSSEALGAASTEDDLEREVGFYNMTLGLVRAGRDKLRALGEPYKRPPDFFCEMTKSDAHMAKVKENLLFQQKKMDAFEQRKKRQAEIKYSKALQAEKAAEKSAKKKAELKEVDDWRKEAKQRRGAGLADKANGSDDGGPPPPPGKSKKQKYKDKKWGYGGVKKGKKKNDAKSLNEMKSFNPQKGKAGVKKRKGGGGGGGGGKKARK